MADFTRVVIPDSHGCLIDRKAAKAFLKDLKTIGPREVIFLGDHVDVSGIYSVHPPSYVKDLDYTLTDDYEAAEWFLDEVAKAAPKATGDYIAGNHENHVERWISRTFGNAKDARSALEKLSPAKRLRVKERGFRYIESSERYDRLSIPGVTKRGKCHFTHGITASRYATAAHVQRFGGNVVHGHTHRAQEYRMRTVASEAIGGWCPGTLAELQPLYRHTSPTDHTHGYAVQFVRSDGRFMHLNVPIINGWSGFESLVKSL